MVKSFLQGFAKKAGESLWTWLWPLVAGGVTALWVWLGAPKQLTFSHRELVLYGLAVVGSLLVAYGTGFYVARRRFARKPPVVDSLQQEVLCLLWTQRHNTVPFNDMLKLTRRHPSMLRLAGERLQLQGLIAFNYLGHDSLMQLLPDGREYMVTAGLDTKAEPTLAERIQRLDD